MDFPEFMQALPGLDVPFPEDVVSLHAIRSDRGLVVFFTVHKDVDVPEHSHGPQWGAIFEGRMDLTIGGVMKTRRPGDTWDIPANVPHAARFYAGSRLMDVFAEPDRYRIRP